MIEEYDEYGEIKLKPERQLSFDQEHRIHQTKDTFVGSCSMCQQDMKKHVQTYWSDDE